MKDEKWRMDLSNGIYNCDIFIYKKYGKYYKRKNNWLV